MSNIQRRDLLKLGVFGAGAVWANMLLEGCAPGGSGANRARLARYPDANGVRLPAGFRSRIVARSGVEAVAGCGYAWHAAPDGGACFTTFDGGWIYVSNSEVDNAGGGAGALRFDRKGVVVGSYALLRGTSRNCAGGATPWGTWLSCEETATGRVWECDPQGVNPPVPRPALGVFNHEAVAVDVVTRTLYLTEDQPDGGLYRFTPAVYPDLSAGMLEIAVTSKAGTLTWAQVPDPTAASTETRHQVASRIAFNGGEGIVYHDGRVYFTTKGDNRVWSLDTSSHQLDIIYDDDNAVTPVLTGVDNITVSSDGSLYVAEDGGDLQVVVIDVSGRIYPMLELVGHDRSEITGVAFSPDGTRLYLSSQRGIIGTATGGITFEVTGPF